MPAAAPDDCSPESGGWYSYAVIRVVPRVERGEFLNAGIILFARTLNYLEARIELNETRLTAFAPALPLAEIRSHLDAFSAIAAGDPRAGSIGLMDPSQRFHWLTSPRSTVIQTSPIHVGWCDAPASLMADLMNRLVR